MFINFQYGREDEQYHIGNIELEVEYEVAPDGTIVFSKNNRTTFTEILNLHKEQVGGFAFIFREESNEIRVVVRAREPMEYKFFVLETIYEDDSKRNNLGFYVMMDLGQMSLGLTIEATALDTVPNSSK